MFLSHSAWLVRLLPLRSDAWPVRKAGFDASRSLTPVRDSYKVPQKVNGPMLAACLTVLSDVKLMWPRPKLEPYGKRH